MMKKNLITKKIVVMLVLATIFFLSGCAENEEPGSEETRVISDLTYLNLRPIDDIDLIYFLNEFESSVTEEYWFGSSFGVIALDRVLAPDEDFYGVIELTDRTEYLTANFSSIKSHAFYFSFKVFINYEEVAFRVRGEENYATEFLFLLEPGYQVDIPFTLDLELSEENVTYKLIAGMFIVDPNQVIHDENHYIFDDFGSMGFVLNHDLIIGLGSEINFAPDANITLLSREESIGGGTEILIAPEFKLNEYGFRARPDLTMQVRRGEDIELLFETTPRVSSGYELENYLIIGMLNGQQVLLNGNSFIFVDVGDHEFNRITDNGSFTLDAIDEVGYYDFIMILIPNPAKRNSLANSFPLFVSNRIIIEVIE